MIAIERQVQRLACVTALRELEDKLDGLALRLETECGDDPVAEDIAVSLADLGIFAGKTARDAGG